MTESPQLTLPSLLESRTSYRRSIEMLEQRAGWLPDGWRPAYSTMLVRLCAVENISRQHVVLSGPFLARGTFNVHVATRDPVVEGILRKATASTASTCQRCACTGIGREREDDRMVLCARCFAAYDLFLEASKLLEVLDGHGFSKGCEVFGFQEMKPSIRCLISEYRWHRLRSAVPGVDTRYLLFSELLELKDMFDRLRQYLVRELQVHTW